MPNWSHGQAGIAASLAAAGMTLERPDLVVRATSGAEHLLSMADTSDGGLRLPHRIPGLPTWTPSPTPGATDRPGPRCCSRPSIALESPPLPVPHPASWSWPASTRCASRGFPSASTPASGTTTAAAAARPGPAMSSSARGSATVAMRTPPSRSPWLTPSSIAPSVMASTRSGGSSSTATRSHCCHPARAGCRAPPASRPISSGWRESSSRAAAPSRWRAWTPGGWAHHPDGPAFLTGRSRRSGRRWWASATESSRAAHAHPSTP